jgi:hypothetical protein
MESTVEFDREAHSELPLWMRLAIELDLAVGTVKEAVWIITWIRNKLDRPPRTRKIRIAANHFVVKFLKPVRMLVNEITLCGAIPHVNEIDLLREILRRNGGAQIKTRKARAEVVTYVQDNAIGRVELALLNVISSVLGERDIASKPCLLDLTDVLRHRVIEDKVVELKPFSGGVRIGIQIVRIDPSARREGISDFEGSIDALPWRIPNVDRRRELSRRIRGNVISEFERNCGVLQNEIPVTVIERQIGCHVNRPARREVEVGIVFGDKCRLHNCRGNQFRHAVLDREVQLSIRTPDFDGLWPSTDDLERQIISMSGKRDTVLTKDELCVFSFLYHGDSRQAVVLDLHI